MPGRTGRASFQSPAKFNVGESGAANEKRLHEPGDIIQGGSPANLRHAWGQESVERVARRMSEESGEIIPSLAAQTLIWTEIRRGAGGGKDAEYEEMVRHYQPPQPSHTATWRESRVNPETGEREHTGRMSSMEILDQPPIHKKQGELWRYGPRGEITPNPRAVQSERERRRLAREATQPRGSD